jgi:hypothetical protein
VFLINSRHSLLCALVSIIIIPQDPFSRSYEVILPSSFNIIIPITLVYYTNPPVYSLGYGHIYTNRCQLVVYNIYFQNAIFTIDTLIHSRCIYAPALHMLLWLENPILIDSSYGMNLRGRLTLLGFA